MNAALSARSPSATSPRTPKMRNPMAVLDSLGRTLAHQAGVRVVVGGSEAYTDGKRIVLPSLPYDLDEAQWRTTNGYLDHEAGHVLFSDFSVIPQDPLLAQVLNTLEDPRIERCFCQRYPGAALNLRAAHDAAWAQLEPQAPQLEAYQQRLLALLCRMEGIPVPAGLGEDAAQWSLQWVPRRQEVLNAPDTAALLPLAREIHAGLLAPTPQQQAAQAAAGPGEPDSEGSGEGEQPRTHGPPGHSPADQSGPPGGDSTPHTALGAPGASSAAPRIPEPQTPPSTESLLSATIRGQVDAVAHCGTYTPPKLSRRATPATADPSALAATVSRLVPGLARRLERAVMAERAARWLPDQRRGRIDPRRLARLSTASSDRVFRRLARGEAPATALGLVIDASGSMREALHLGVAAAAVLTRALLRLQVSVEVSAFSGHVITYAKAYDEAEAVLLPRLAAMRSGGGTPLGAVMLGAAKRLIQRPEPRHILVVVSDGQPDNRGHAADTLRRARAVGIEVVGIGIAADLTWLFGAPSTITIPSIHELAPVLLKQAGALMRRTAA
ncbi:MAG: VWA domain-containing protein [Planctomycetota bacterium]|nr:MAG: VWA domain-containing protein [Planctomycetota bacterium]